MEGRREGGSHGVERINEKAAASNRIIQWSKLNMLSINK
jgi:hypothetical protein